MRFFGGSSEVRRAIGTRVALAVWLGMGCSLSLCSGQDQDSKQPPAEVKAEATTTWLVVRHAERDGEKDLLNAAGHSRAEVLRQLGSVLNVSAIYSTDFVRTKETARPLADLLGQEIQLYERPSDEWLEQVRQENAGRVVLIVGHSNTAGVIAGKLAGVDPFPVGHDDYDSLFLVTTGAELSSAVRIKYGPSSAGAQAASPDNMGPVKSSKIPGLD